MVPRLCPRNQAPAIAHDLDPRDQLVECSRGAANHLFSFVATAYETRSFVLTSNWPFEQWTNFLPDATSATAILDRFLHHADVVVLSGDSYRLREARMAPQRPQPVDQRGPSRKRSAEKA